MCHPLTHSYFVNTLLVSEREVMIIQKYSLHTVGFYLFKTEPTVFISMLNVTHWNSFEPFFTPKSRHPPVKYAHTNTHLKMYIVKFNRVKRVRKESIKRVQYLKLLFNCNTFSHTHTYTHPRKTATALSEHDWVHAANQTHFTKQLNRSNNGCIHSIEGFRFRYSKFKQRKNNLCSKFHVFILNAVRERPSKESSIGVRTRNK